MNISFILIIVAGFIIGLTVVYIAFGLLALGLNKSVNCFSNFLNDRLNKKIASWRAKR